MADDLDVAALVAAARQHDEAAARELVRRSIRLFSNWCARIAPTHRTRKTFAR